MCKVKREEAAGMLALFFIMINDPFNVFVENIVTNKTRSD